MFILSLAGKGRLQRGLHLDCAWELSHFCEGNRRAPLTLSIKRTIEAG